MTILSIAASVLTVAVTATGYAQKAPVHKSNAPAAVESPEPRGLLIVGFDGAFYAPYPPEIIQRVQKALRERGLYAGPVNGILDRPTMRALYIFQEANNLQRCGVPTPHTRKMLEQGSHTDLSF
jgi:hypothetical protein